MDIQTPPELTDTPNSGNEYSRYRHLFDTIDQGFCIIEMQYGTDGGVSDYRFIEVNAAFEQQTGLVDATSKTMREHRPEHEEHWFEIYGEIDRSRQPRRFEAEATQLSAEYEVYAFPFDSPDLHRVGILFNDISERRKAERYQQLVMREQGHRFANLLAVFRSIIRKSLPGISQEEFDTVAERITSYARAEELLVNAKQAGTSIVDLIRLVMEPHLALQRDNIEINGPDLTMGSVVGQSLALALHELGTNAVKYGALSEPTGKVDIHWHVEGDALRLTWKETGGPPIISQPVRTGFGTQLIEGALAYSAGGKVDVAYEVGGLRATMLLPLKDLSR